MENLKYTEILMLNKSLVGKINSRPYEIGILSNVTVNSAKEILEYVCRSNQIEPNIEIGNFDNIVQDSAVFNDKDLVIIIYDVLNIVDRVSGFFEDITDEKYDNLKNSLFDEINIILDNLSSTSSVIFNSFSDKYFAKSILSPSRIGTLVNELNNFLKSRNNGNVTIVDIDNIFSEIGFKNAIDFRFYNSSKAPYTFNFFKYYVSSIEALILKNTGKLKKAIIFDCDNTLWKGIIGEDGPDGIDMAANSKSGKYFHAVQNIAVYLSKRGVIIGICSKNNEQDVLDVLKNHKDAVLKEEHIVISKINWNNKVTNLNEIASELNIGIDSLVFIDDSNFEINLVKEQLPEVHTVQVPVNISDYPEQILKTIYKFFNLIPTADDARKTAMYKQQFEREKVKKTFTSIDDYLAALGIELTILENDSSNIPRISQLTQKTNQFNLTSRRYTEKEVELFLNDGKTIIFSMFVKDKFGDNGLTGLCIVKTDEDNSENAIIDTFLMSCRVIGRNIEFAFFNYLIMKLAKLNFKTLSAEFIKTKKNIQVESFYDKLKLVVENKNPDRKDYFVNIANFEYVNFEYIKINELSN